MKLVQDSLLLLVLLCSGKSGMSKLLKVSQTIAFEVDQQYTASLKFGLNTLTTVTALLNVDGTLVNSLNCTDCTIKAYNVSEGLVIKNESVVYPYPMPGFALSFDGVVV